MAKKEPDKQLKDPDDKKNAGDLFKKEFKKKTKKEFKKTIKF
ncbi:MAG: hypothetical protein ABFC12_08515 [Methanobacterium sp.]